MSNTVDHVISDNANKTENCGCVSKGSMSVIECECSMSYDAPRLIGREWKPHSLRIGDYLYQDADILKYEELMNKQKQNQDTVEKKNIPEIEDKNEVKTTNTILLGNQVVTQMLRNSIPPQCNKTLWGKCSYFPSYNIYYM